MQKSEGRKEKNKNDIKDVFVIFFKLLGAKMISFWQDGLLSPIGKSICVGARGRPVMIMLQRNVLFFFAFLMDLNKQFSHALKSDFYNGAEQGVLSIMTYLTSGTRWEATSGDPLLHSPHHNFAFARNLSIQDQIKIHAHEQEQGLNRPTCTHCCFMDHTLWIDDEKQGHT